MWYLVTRAFAFAGIKHKDLTPFLRWSPVVTALIITFCFWLLPVRPKVVGEGSLSDYMITIFAILPGFFIAALAAVATFDRSEMDEIMPDPAPEIKLRTGNNESYVKLTFRMFMSQLFAYLSTLSFCAVFLFVAIDITAPSWRFLIEKIHIAISHAFLSDILVLIYVWIVSWLAAKIILTTLIGLYFLAERMHRPNA